MTTPPVLGLVAINDVYTLAHLPRLASLIEHTRRTVSAERWCVVVAGDFVAPSVLSSLDGGRRMVQALNALGVTHVVLGNHEDDVPATELSARVQELSAVCLGTNVHGFTPALPEADVLDVGGTRVALLGAVMDDANVYRRPPFGGARLEAPNTAIAREAQRQRATGVDAVIAITHQWLDDDRRLAASGVVDLVLGGHEHEPFLEQHGHATLSKSGMDATVAAIALISLGPTPTVTVRHEPVAAYPEHPSLRALADEADAFVAKLAGAVLLPRLSGPLSSEGSRVRQTSMGTFVTSTLRDALGADAAIFNGGGLRGSEAHTDVLTLGDLQGELPFDNEIVVVDLEGAALREAVAWSRRLAPRSDGGFLHVDDRCRVADDARTLVTVAGAPLDDSRCYRVAAPRAHLLGLDRITPLEQRFSTRPERVPAAGSGRPPRLILLDALVRRRLDALGGFDALDADHDGRISREDLTRAMTEREGAPSPATVSLVISTLDANRDETLTRDETEDE